MQIAMTVNGTSVAIDGRAHENLLDALRRAGFTGCKEGCAEGECGACAVLVRRRPAVHGIWSEWAGVNSCLVPALDLVGGEVVTSEGLSGEALHPVPRALAEAGGSQCGFCTPGFVCAAAAEYYRADRGGTGTFDIHALSGNLCRCTGYRPIHDAVQTLDRPDEHDPLAQTRTAPPPPSFHVEHDDASVTRPRSLDEALQTLHELASAGKAPTIVAGATDYGVEINLRHLRPNHVLLIGAIETLRQIRRDAAEIRIGAAATLTDVERELGDRVPLLAHLWPQFASRLIRSRATIGGNLGTGSPIGDTAPALLALDAVVVLVSARGERRVPLENYFTGYRTSVRQPDELISQVVLPTVPLPEGHRRIEHFVKIAKRRFDDISSVAVAACIDIDSEGIVTRARIGAGGLAATPLRAVPVEQALVGAAWSLPGIASAAALMREVGTPLDDLRASSSYRRAMAEQALRKICAESEVKAS